MENLFERLRIRKSTNNRMPNWIICFIVIINIGTLFILTPLGGEAVVKAVEIVLNRKSVDPDYLVWHVRTVVSAYVVLVTLLVCFVIYTNKLYKFFFTYSLFTFFYTNFFIWQKKEFYGFRGCWDYGDFVTSIVTGYGDLYGTNYPPLAVAFFKLFFAFVGKLEIQSSAINYSVFLYTIFSFLFLYILISYYLCEKCIKISFDKMILIAICLTITSPILFSVQRLNLALIALAFVGLFLLSYNSNNGAIRLIGLTSLAIAANIKYYPAVFGIVLIKEKKWKEAVIAITEGILLFFMPGVLTGHMSINGLFDASASFVDTFGGGMLSLKRIISDVLMLFGGTFSNGVSSIIFVICEILFFGMCVLGALFCKNMGHTLAYAAFMCIFIPPVSFGYNVVFLLIPFVVLLKRSCTEGVFTVLDKTEFTLYTLIFAYVLNYPSFINISDYRLILILVVVICVSTIRQIRLHNNNAL